MAEQTNELEFKTLNRWLKYIYLSTALFIFVGCTWSFIMNHSEGTTSDLVDETQSTSPTISPEFNIPVTP